jgi:diguanylate cyclase (GGDEF)-like protein
MKESTRGPMPPEQPRPSDFPPSWMAVLLKTAFPALAIDVPPSVLALAVQRHVETGEIVCTPDRPLEALTVVITGNLRLDKDGHIIRNFGPGDYFGEGGLVRDAVPGVTISALEPSDLLQFPRDSLQRIIDAEPTFGVAFMQALLAQTMGRLQATNQLFADNRSLAQQLAQTVDRLDGTLAQLQDSEERMRFLASHDPLTQLGTRTGRRFAVLMVDLDHFKPINDVHGHGAGDAVLATVARRIGEITRAGDTVARLGGDEFIVVQDLVDTESAERVGTLAERMIASLSAPIDVDSVKCRVGASIGIALYPEDGATAEDLLRHADLALYRAKAEGRGCYAFFTPALGEQAIRFAAVKASISQAIYERQLSVHYQPIVDLASRRIIGAEALVRWQHPKYGAITPAEFLPVAERSGLIGSLGAFVLRDACAAAARWRAIRPGGFKLTVNFSPTQFRLQNVKALIEAVVAAGMPPAELELELSERSLMHDVDDTIRSVRSLQDLGVSIAIDDFGTGSASLIAIRRLAADTLKIDSGLVAGCAEPSEAADVVRAAVDIALDFGMQVVAEGVETAAQLDALQRLRCDAAQGYLLSPPLDAAAMERFLGQHAGTDASV